MGSILEERVSLKGAKEPFNFFLLECDPTTAGVSECTCMPDYLLCNKDQPQLVGTCMTGIASFLPANQRPSVDDSLYHGRMAGQQLQSPELVVFQENRLSLHTGIINNIRDITRLAFARGLIPDGVSRNITDTQSHAEKTDLLLRELESRIRNNRRALTQFVDLLRESDAACYAIHITAISMFCTVASDAVGF